MEYASNGKGNAALTTGIIGTAGVGLSMLGGLLGGVGRSCDYGHGDHIANRYELSLSQELATERSRNALLEANIYNDQKMLELYRYVDSKFERMERKMCEQDVFNAQLASGLGSVSRTVSGLTKTVIPIESICPDVMRRYNSWVAPTAEADAPAA